MRNLAQYPITFDDKMGVLKSLLDREIYEDDRDMIMGSIIGATLRAVMEDVERLAEIEKQNETPVDTFRQSMEDSRNARDQ